MTDEWRETNSEAVSEALAAAAGVGVGSVLGGPVGAIAGGAAAPYAARAVRAIADVYFQRRNESPTRLIESAAQLLGIEPDELANLAMGDKDRLQLSGEAIWAAWHTLNEVKIESLARALANGLTEDVAQVDEARLIVAALAEMEAPHIKLLAFLATQTSVDRRYTRPISLGQIVRQSTGFTNVTVGSAMATLERHDCVAREHIDVDKIIQARERAQRQGSPVVGGGTSEVRFEITSFGLRCLDYLEGRPD